MIIKDSRRGDKVWEGEEGVAHGTDGSLSGTGGVFAVGSKGRRVQVLGDNWGG